MQLRVEKTGGAFTDTRHHRNGLLNIDAILDEETFSSKKLKNIGYN
jgi:hypothetical protein